MAAFDISFLVIGVYWVKNLEYYSLIAKVDIPFVWMKLIYLIFIMLLPVANLLFMLFPEGIGPRVLFSLLMIGSGLIAYAGMFYAHRKRLLHPHVDLVYAKAFTKQLLAEPIIATFAVGMAFIHPHLWDLSFVLIPIALLLRKRIGTAKN